jgi:hypothetical protein
MRAGELPNAERGSHRASSAQANRHRSRNSSEPSSPAATSAARKMTPLTAVQPKLADMARSEMAEGGMRELEQMSVPVPELRHGAAGNDAADFGYGNAGR